MWMSAVMTSSDRYSPVSSRTLDLDGLRDLVFEPFASHAFRGHGIAGRDLVPSAYRRDGPCGYDTLLRMMEGHLKYNGVAVDVPEGLDIEVLEIADLRIFHELCNAQGLPVPDLGSTTDNPYTEASDMIFRDGLRGRWMDRRWLEVACLAQHYGVPTRLLDWTTDVNVALHFAAGSALRHMDGPGDGFCIWVLDLDAAKAVILRLYDPVLSQLTPERMGKDSKTQLQEFLQAHHIGLPEYTVIDIRGAAHDQTFECECGIKKLNIAVRGTGKNRRTAEQMAAKQALELAIDYFDKKRGHQHG